MIPANPNLLGKSVDVTGVACSVLLDLIVVLMFVMQLVMALWLYELTSRVCNRDKKPKPPKEQL
jgi:hypothetical protein